MSHRLNHEKANTHKRVVKGFWAGVPPMPKPRYREDPATEKQITYLQCLQLRRRRQVIDRIDALKLTRSEASRLIKELRDG